MKVVKLSHPNYEYDVHSLVSMTPVALDDVRASLAEVTFEEAQARAEAALNGDFYHPAN